MQVGDYVTSKWTWEQGKILQVRRGGTELLVEWYDCHRGTTWTSIEEVE